MRIIATYTNPNYSYERRMCGINSFRNVVHPNGFKKEYIECKSLEELSRKVGTYDIAFEHFGPRRNLRVEDCTIKIIED